MNRYPRWPIHLALLVVSFVMLVPFVARVILGGVRSMGSGGVQPFRGNDAVIGGHDFRLRIEFAQRHLHALSRRVVDPVAFVEKNEVGVAHRRSRAWANRSSTASSWGASTRCSRSGTRSSSASSSG